MSAWQWILCVLLLCPTLSWTPQMRFALWFVVLFHLRVRIVLWEDKVGLLLFLPLLGFILSFFSLPMLTSVSAHNSCTAFVPHVLAKHSCALGVPCVPAWRSRGFRTQSHIPSPDSLQLLVKEELMANCVDRLLINSFSAGAVPIPHKSQQSNF